MTKMEEKEEKKKMEEHEENDELKGRRSWKNEE